MAFFDDIKDDEPKAGQSSNNENSSTNNSRDRVKDEPPHSEDNLGEAPEFPPLFFTYDDIKKKFQVKDKRGNVKAEVDIMTVDGADAYHLWKKGRAEGSDTSYTAYLKDIKGQDGKNGKNAFEEWQDSRDPNTDRSWEAYLKFFKGDDGKSAFEQWKEVHGEYTNPDIDDFFNYFKGQDGKDAYEVWKDMGFHGDKQAFFEWLAGLVKAEPGKDGKTYYPHFDGYELYFTEDPEGEKPVVARQNLRGQQGRTYEPKMEGTVLHFDDGEGDKTDPIDLKGKDAFDLWKEYHHKPDAKYEEFEDFFKGQNVKSDHSYLDIKDFTCPVQTIDTELIANVLDSAKSPDELIKLRQEDIDNLRKEGESLNKELDKEKKWYKFFPLSFLLGSKIYKNWAGFFKEFSWWCAGADRPLLRMCPGDHSKYTGIGTVILFTAIMAFFSSSIAMSLVFPDSDKDFSTMGLVSGAVWAAMIFCLDRFITNTMYSDGKVTISKDELIGGLPRILIAIFLGIVISAPLELKIFSAEIDNYVYNELKTENKVGLIQEKQDSIFKCRTRIENFENSKINLKNNQKKIPSINKQIEQQQELREQAIATAIKGISKGNTSGSIRRLPGETDEDFANRKRNASSSDNSSFARDKASAEQLAAKPYDEKIAELQAQIVELTADTNVYNGLILAENQRITSFDSLYKEKERRADSIFDANIGLGVKLQALHAIAMKDYTPWFYNEPPKNAIVLNRGVNETKPNKIFVLLDTLLHSWWWFLFNSAIGLIMMLFILIDISPVLYKMMLADGVYDNYLHQEKLLAQDKIRLSLARMLRNIEKGELKALSPFIMGKIYRKLMKFSTNGSGKYGNEEKDYKQHIEWGDTQGLNREIKDTNDDVFRIVLDYKKRIVLASYAAWYRDMRDAMIGAKDDFDGEKINPQSHFQEDERHTVNDTEESGNSSTEDSQSTNQESEESDSNDNG